MDFAVKVKLPRHGRNEYITDIHVKNIKDDKNQAIREAINYINRAHWLRLSDIEKTKLIFEVKTL